MAWLRSDLGALRDERSTYTMFYEHATEPLSPGAAVAARKLVDVADRVIEADHDQLFTTWSIADADLAFMLHRLILNGHEVPRKLRSYAERQWKRRSIREFVEHERPKQGARPR
jgi:glutathione S-transferase